MRRRGLALGFALALLGSARAAPGLKARLLAGNQAYKARRFAEAAREWKVVAAARPTGDRWYRVGLASYRARDRAGAVDAFRRAVVVEPGHAKACRALKKLGEDACAAPPGPSPAPPDPTPEPTPAPRPRPTQDGPRGDWLAEVEPGADDAAAEQAWTDGHRLRRLGEYQKAARRFVDAYRHGYTRAEVDYYLGRVLLEDERVDDAVVHLERARQAVPQDQSIHLTLAKAYALRGEPSDQLKSLQAALDLDPGFGEAHFLAALAWDARGETARVLEHAQKAIRIDAAYRARLEAGLRDGAAVKRLGGMLRGGLEDDPDGPAEPDALDGYAARLAELLYPDALPAGPARSGAVVSMKSRAGPQAEVRSRQGKTQAAKRLAELATRASRQDQMAEGMAESVPAAPAAPAASRVARLGAANLAGVAESGKPAESLGDSLDSAGFGGADLGDADLGAGEDVAGDVAGEAFGGADLGAIEDLGADELGDAGFEEADELGPAPAASPLRYAVLREVLQDLHRGKGRRAFERIPHRERPAFMNRFLEHLRSAPGLKDLRRRVEAALRS